MGNGQHKKLSRPRVMRDVDRVLFRTLEDENIVKPGRGRLTHVPAVTYKADKEAWGRILKVVEQRLHAKRIEYKVLVIGLDDVKATLQKPLWVSVDRLTNEILEGNKVVLTAPTAA